MHTRLTILLIWLLFFCSCNQSQKERSRSSNESNVLNPLENNESQETDNQFSNFVYLETLSTDDPKNNWIEVRKVSTIPTTEGGELILIFSLYNKSDYNIENITVRLIAKDKEGIPVDYQEYEFFPDGILSGLSKQVDRRNPLNPYIAEPNGGEVEFKILSFSIN